MYDVIVILDVVTSTPAGIGVGVSTTNCVDVVTMGVLRLLQNNFNIFNEKKKIKKESSLYTYAPGGKHVGSSGAAQVAVGTAGCFGGGGGWGGGGAGGFCGCG